MKLALQHYDVIIIGAGAAGLMCAAEAARRGRSVLVLDHAEKPAEKIRISGGGRCNFTNINCGPDNFISANPQFCTSALKRYTPEDFIALVDRHGIAWHEKTLGQLFCDGSAQQIIAMLLAECNGATVQTATAVTRIDKVEDVFYVQTDRGDYTGAALVIATGGPSIPKMGASGFGYAVARQFGLNVIEPRPGLVPLTFGVDFLQSTKTLSGVAVDPVTVEHDGTMFREALLFTHRGLSGPAILQISSYWQAGETITLNLSPDRAVFEALKLARREQAKRRLRTILGDFLPQRLADLLAADFGPDRPLADFSDKDLKEIAASIEGWDVKPQGSEGYRTAEVTLGGVDTAALSSKTFEAKALQGLYFIGEVIDVTGWLGGYNFQWAWASGWCCGQYV